MGSQLPSDTAPGTWYLCWFLHRYLDFRLPEAEACAEAEGCQGKLAWCVVAVSAPRRAHSVSLLHLTCDVTPGACRRATPRTRRFGG